MAQIRLKSEAELIKCILNSDHYRRVKERFFGHKIDREKEAWKRLQAHRGKFAPEILRGIIDKVDIDPMNRRWFGQMLSVPNQNHLLRSPVAVLNEWIKELLFSRDPIERRLDRCLGEIKIKGASRGLATLLLYLSDPGTFNIWVKATEEGMTTLGRIGDLPSMKRGASYLLFNEAAVAFRKDNKLAAHEIDWFLTHIRG